MFLKVRVASFFKSSIPLSLVAAVRPIAEVGECRVHDYAQVLNFLAIWNRFPFIRFE